MRNFKNIKEFGISNKHDHTFSFSVFILTYKYFMFTRYLCRVALVLDLIYRFFYRSSKNSLLRSNVHNISSYKPKRMYDIVTSYVGGYFGYVYFMSILL